MAKNRVKSYPEMTKPYIRVLSVKALENHRLQVVLSNGREGVFDVAPYLDIGVFKRLKEPAYFSRVKTLFAGVGWPGGQASARSKSPMKCTRSRAARLRPAAPQPSANRKRPLVKWCDRRVSYGKKPIVLTDHDMLY